MMSNFFRAKCPMTACQADLHVVRIIGEPISNPNWLGVTVLCCYECNRCFFTEAVTDKMPSITTAILRVNRRHKVDLKRVLATYEDLASMCAAYREYCLLSYRHGGTLSERALHFLSASYSYLNNLQGQLEYNIRQIRLELQQHDE